MLQAGIHRPEMYRKAQTILLDIGKLYQIQDDYLDCYGDPGITGKVGTDIRDGKCTWLIIVAMQRANKQQKEVLRANYGRVEEDCVAAVKAVYDELKLPKVYRTFEEEERNDIVQLIKQLPGEGKLELGGIPSKVFTNFMDRIYKRDA